MRKPMRAKQAKAPWVTAFPEQVKRREDSREGEERIYKEEVSAWIAELRKKGTVCPVMAYLFPGTKILVQECHHIRGRNGTLLRDRRYHLAVSHAGHMAIHANIELARMKGWYAQKGLWNVEEPLPQPQA